MRRADALSLARTLVASGARVIDRKPDTATVCETPRCPREATPPARLCDKCQRLAR